MVILENIDIDIDIDKAILQNIDIDKISNRFKFGISNRAMVGPFSNSQLTLVLILIDFGQESGPTLRAGPTLYTGVQRY